MRCIQTLREEQKRTKKKKETKWKREREKKKKGLRAFEREPVGHLD
jgi:hypothetical protein